MSPRSIVAELLKKADVEIDGSHKWDIRVHNEEFFGRVLRGGTLALGESYMDSWWDSPKLDEFVSRALCARLDKELSKKPLFGAYILGFILLSRIFNRQNIKRAFQVAHAHYNIGNDLYTKMLDPWMQYSCGYWKGGITHLAQAQEAKLDLIARKLKLKAGMCILDVGCGWGGLAKYLASKYNVSVVGVTISNEQAKFAREWINDPLVEIQVTDYRDLREKPFDRIVSVGMFEHVGYKNYRTFMQHMHRMLKKNGIFLLHTIGGNVTRYTTDPWIDKYIFPNGMLPSPAQILKNTENLFVLEDWHTFGPDYDKTLMAWYENFKNAWPELSQSGKYDKRFYRMWEYYLLSCAGAFRARKTNLWQIVLSKGLPEGYVSVR